ncbi:MAG: TonB-dependent receptor, partial [Moraxellaceae bacterium]
MDILERRGLATYFKLFSVAIKFTLEEQNAKHPFATWIARGFPEHLNPEIASNLEAGVVYSPVFVPGLRLSFDYFRINLKDAIVVG